MPRGPGSVVRAAVALSFPALLGALAPAGCGTVPPTEISAPEPPTATMPARPESGDADGEAGSRTPQNVIVLIGDGMGYGHLAAANLAASGQSRYQLRGSSGPAGPVELPGEAVHPYEEWSRLSAATHPAGESYHPATAWSGHPWIGAEATDSAAAATALSTGVKTVVGAVGVDPAGEPRENLVDRAEATGRSTGVVTSVPFSHATPAAWSVHAPSRWDVHTIAERMIGSELDVILGAGHPGFDDDGRPRESPDHQHLSRQSHRLLTSGRSGFTYLDEAPAFSRLARGTDLPQRVFGLAPIGSSLPPRPAADDAHSADDPAADVPDLATLADGALNVLAQDPDGFHLMIEGGAIDWAAHDQDTAGTVAEIRSFHAAVDAVVEWVEGESSWRETLVVVTADHATGVLSGTGDRIRHAPLSGEAGEIPEVQWLSGEHTDRLVPFFHRGAGSAALQEQIIGADPVRGPYVDNTALAEVLLDDLWR